MLGPDEAVRRGSMLIPVCISIAGIIQLIPVLGPACWLCIEVFNREPHPRMVVRPRLNMLFKADP